MSKYDYLIITTKRNLSEADHTKILTSYGLQGFRLVKEKKHLLGRITYTLERDLAPQSKVEVHQKEPSPNIGKRGLLIVPDKYIYEITEVLLKAIELSKGREVSIEKIPLEVEKLLIDWIVMNRPDKKGRL